MSQREINTMAKQIIEAHNGQSYFNFTETAKIIGCGKNTVAYVLNNSGVTVKKIGPSKRVSAFDLAEIMAKGRVAAVE